MHQTKKQHWISLFILKGWLQNGKILIWNLKSKKIEESTFDQKRNKFKNDKFYKSWFYENDHYEINTIEKKLARIENDFSNLIHKKFNYDDLINQHHINLTLKEWVLIKYFLLINFIRTPTARNIWKEKSNAAEDQINNTNLWLINLLIDSYYSEKFEITNLIDNIDKKSPLSWKFFFPYFNPDNFQIKIIFNPDKKFFLSDAIFTDINNFEINQFSSLIKLFPIKDYLIFGMQNISFYFSLIAGKEMMRFIEKINDFEKTLNLPKNFFIFNNEDFLKIMESDEKTKKQAKTGLQVVNISKGKIKTINSFLLKYVDQYLVFKDKKDLEATIKNQEN